MSDNLKKQFPKLEVLSQVKSNKRRQSLLKEFSEDPKFCQAVREIVKNTLNKNIKVSQSDKVKLQRYKAVILGIGKKHKTKGKLKRLVQQSGTGIFLPIVVPLVAAVLSELFK